MDGRLIGINTAIYSQSGGSIGIGFAIPSNMVRSVVAGFSGGGRLRAAVARRLGPGRDRDLAQAFGLRRPTGVLVEEVCQRRSGRAGRHPHRATSCWRSTAGRSTTRRRCATASPRCRSASSVDMLVWRQREERTLAAAGARRTGGSAARTRWNSEGAQPLAGATVANLSPALAEELGTDRYYRGVVVLSVVAGSNAAPDRAAARRPHPLGQRRGRDVQLRAAQAGRADARSAGRSSSAAATSASTSSSAAELAAQGEGPGYLAVPGAGAAAARRPAAAAAAGGGRRARTICWRRTGRSAACWRPASSPR